METTPRYRSPSGSYGFFFILNSYVDNQQVSMSIEYQNLPMRDTVRGVHTSLVHVRRGRKAAFENVIYLGQIIIVNVK